jgi:hypothetical protein
MLSESINIWSSNNESFAIISKGTELPTSYTKVFTKEKGQPTLSFYLFKDYHNQITQQNLIGEFWFSTNQQEAKSKIEVKVIVNSNKEIKVIAKDKGTGQKKTMVFLEPQNAMNQNNIKSYISENINKLKKEGGDVNYTIFTLNSGYFIQIATGKDDDLIRCEASISNGGHDGNYENATLSLSQLETLEELGWKPPEFGEFNYYYFNTIEPSQTLDDQVNNFLQTINEVYNGSEIVKTTINLE